MALKLMSHIRRAVEPSKNNVLYVYGVL